VKERVIGVTLFGRAPCYETGEDSIVRVAAGDVHKPLIHHYSIYGMTSGFHLSRPLGPYHIEIKRCPTDEKTPPDAPNSVNQLTELTFEPGALHSGSNSPSADQVATPPIAVPEPVRMVRRNLRNWVFWGTLLVVEVLRDGSLFLIIFLAGVPPRFRCFRGRRFSTPLIPPYW
jgi:hypothetical protein